MITKVTVAGVTGAIGIPIVEALVGAGYEVQALTRSSIVANTIPLAVKLVEVDYGNLAALRTILEGQDVVISTLGDTAGAVAAQEVLILAAIAAGVRRFVPSEFGSDTENERVRSMPFFADKLKHRELLENAAAINPHFTYSIFVTGPFLDWGLSVVPFIINVGLRSADVFDGDDVPFSVTRVATLSKAIVASLQHFETTANRTLYVHDAVITQNQLIDIEEKLSEGKSFHRNHVDTEALEAQAWQSFKDPASDPLTWIFPFINVSIWSKEQLCAFFRTDNELLDIPEPHGVEFQYVLAEEIFKAKQTLGTAVADAATSASSSTKEAAQKALEDGKRRLVGFRRPRRESQIERVVG